MKKVLQVLWGELPDFRVFKTAKILSEEGWQVDLLCISSNNNQWEFGKCFEIPAPSFFKKVTNKVNKWAHCNQISHLDNWKLAFLLKILKEGNYQVVHWNDLAWSLEALPHIRKFGAKFIMDLHENYPYSMWSTERDINVKNKRYNLNEWFRYEKKAIELCDAVMVVASEMGQRLVGMHGSDYHKITTVLSAEPIDLWKDIEPPEQLKEKFKNKLVMLYVGSCSLHRGLDVIIKALSKVRKIVNDIVFVVVGDGKGIPHWKKLAQDLKVDDIVSFEGYKTFLEVQKYYKIADFGVIPHHKYGQTDNGIPHKFFQNLICGKPVLVSSCHSLQTVVEENQVGLIFKAGDVESAGQKIVELSDENLRKKKGQVGFALAQNGPLSFDEVKKSMMKIYDRII